MEAALYQDRAIVLLAPEGPIPAVHPVCKDLIPVDCLDQFLHVVGRPSGGVESTDDRAHTGADHQVGGDVQLLEDTDDADVGSAPGAATREDQDELRLFLDRLFGREGCDQREHQGRDDKNPDWTGIHDASEIFSR